MNTQNIKRGTRTSVSLLLATIAMVVGPLLQIGLLTANAASLTVITDTMSKQGVSDTADHTVKWTNATSNTANDTITIDFTEADIVSTGAWQTTDFALTDGSHSALAPISVTTGGGPTCTATDNYGVEYTNSTSTFVVTLCSGWVTSTGPTTLVLKGATGGAGFLTNKSTDVDNSVYSITYTGASTDSGTGVLVVETNADVSVTASVSQTLTFSVDDNAIGFGPLTLANTRWATTNAAGSNTDATGNTLTASTNATGGYNITIFGALLTSGSNDIDSIGTSATPLAAAGTDEQFGIHYVASGAGTATVSSPYNTSDYAYDGTTLPDIIAASTGPTATNSFAAHYAANIDTGTAAGNYSTTFYYVATGSF